MRQTTGCCERRTSRSAPSKLIQVQTDLATAMGERLVDPDRGDRPGPRLRRGDPVVDAVVRRRLALISEPRAIEARR
jgi:hypothetical protein